MRRLRLVLVSVLSVAAALALASTANALIVLGAVAPPDLGGCGSCDVFQLKSGPAAPDYVVPAGPTGLWTVNTWSTQGGGVADGRARLRVYRRTATAGRFKLVKQSHVEMVPADGHPTFTTSLTVKQGDRLGLGTVNNVPSAYNTAIADSTVKSLACDPTGPGQLVGAGTLCPLGTLANSLVNVRATLVPR